MSKINRCNEYITILLYLGKININLVKYDIL